MLLIHIHVLSRTVFLVVVAAVNNTLLFATLCHIRNLLLGMTISTLRKIFLAAVPFGCVLRCSSSRQRKTHLKQTAKQTCQDQSSLYRNRAEQSIESQQRIRIITHAMAARIKSC
ncbi:uncharacterized protein RCC_01321 [Ramularia collo-cygni]|uniref:Uncharacterized protein n=1 Tax=Ramularia collo-cygni TaxID=112498 RepID=A0A2D3UQG6_9PEZI|nr:uncharacterized protein RCC_01321 [Ramularia collo-cygni]CZT15465.1 uncharacterized protein RCC_01321 [Ramularia collo-cygni]